MQPADRTLTLTAIEIAWLKTAIEYNPTSNPIQDQVYSKLARNPGCNYSLHTMTGTHPDCWFFTVVQAGQAFSLHAETPQEKRSYLGKLESLKEILTKTITTLRKQT
jgi:hypothetical protein